MDLATLIAARNSRNSRMWGGAHGGYGGSSGGGAHSGGGASGPGGQKNILKALNFEESCKLLGTGIDRLKSVWQKFPFFPPQEEPGNEHDLGRR